MRHQAWRQELSDKLFSHKWLDNLSIPRTALPSHSRGRETPHDTPMALCRGLAQDSQTSPGAAMGQAHRSMYVLCDNFNGATMDESLFELGYKFYNGLFFVANNQ